MAPAANIPELDMSMIQKLDILQSYWLLYEHMKEDFVHKNDLSIILNSNTVVTAVAGTVIAPPLPLTGVGTGKALFVQTDAVARAKALVYEKLAKTGGIATEKAIESLEALTS